LEKFSSYFRGFGYISYAAWHPTEGGTLVLRNSTGKPQTFLLDIGAALELPANAPRQWKLTAPLKGQSISSLTAVAGTPQSITFQPFDVLIFDARPRGTAQP
jgi:hypothetical protein